jgi:REP element-mobilizing transposase RayT
MPQSFGCLHVHIIFSTKNREPLLTPELIAELYPYIGGVVRNIGCRLIEIGGMPDHLHLLVSLGRESCVADTVRDIKANSSRWVHEKFPQRAAFAWQAGYGAFAVSLSGVAAVRAYIQNQAEHHHLRTFQDEYREFLRRHEIEWDERYVWD